MGLLCCFAGDKKQAEVDAEARHARIVSVYQNSSEAARTNPPTYNEVVSAVQNSSNRPPIVINEKEPVQINQSRSSSPRTSIISIPSTRLTDLTASITGTSSNEGTIIVRDDTDRLSSMYGSPPPSYYAGSTLREPSLRTPSPGSQRSSTEHPVMSPDWMERLRRDAERHRDRERARGRPHHDGCCAVWDVP